MRPIFFSIFLFAVLFGSSQRLADVSAVFSSTAVVVRFTIKAGPYCSGYSIWHTADSTMPFQSIYDYPSICGEPNNDEYHSYIHDNPVPNQVNFYKVRLEPFEESPILRVYASNRPQPGLFLYPNPVSPDNVQLNMRVLGTENKRLQGFLFNRFGTVQRDLDITTTEGGAALKVNELSEGVYVIWLTDGNNVFSGKFIVKN